MFSKSIVGLAAAIVGLVQLNSAVACSDEPGWPNLQGRLRGPCEISGEQTGYATWTGELHISPGGRCSLVFHPSLVNGVTWKGSPQCGNLTTDNANEWEFKAVSEDCIEDFTIVINTPDPNAPRLTCEYTFHVLESQ
jgi:hypothetical protein